MSSVEGNGKYYWWTQYRNNYQKRVAFSFVMKGQYEEIVNYVRTYGDEYRTELKPGEIDEKMWHSLSNPSKIWEVIGHVRFLGNGEFDIGPDPFATCDTQGNRGMIDYICRNEPKPYIGCQNYVPPAPAAKTLPFPGGRTPSNATPASAEECLKMYETFSAKKNAPDLVKLNQAGEAAGEFRERCKLTVDQTVFIEKELSQIGIRMDALKRRLSANGNADLVSRANAARKGPSIEELKRQISENLKANVIDPASAPSGTIYSNFSINFIGENVVMKISDRDSQYVSHQTLTVPLSNLAFTKEETGNPNWDWLLAFGGSCQEQKTWFGQAPLHIDCGVLYIPHKKSNFENAGSLLKTLQKGGSTNRVAAASSDAEDDASAPRVSPTTRAEYEKNVVAEAKAAGKFPSPEPTATTKRSPPITPKQRAAFEAQNRQKLSELIKRDIEQINGGTDSEDGKITPDLEEPGKIFDPKGFDFTFVLPSILSGFWKPIYENSTSATPELSLRSDSSKSESIHVIQKGWSALDEAVSVYKLLDPGILFETSGFELGGKKGFVLKFLSASPSNRRMRVYFFTMGRRLYQVTVGSRFGEDKWVEQFGDAVVTSFKAR